MERTLILGAEQQHMFVILELFLHNIFYQISYDFLVNTK